jgi:hypothetical protein
MHSRDLVEHRYSWNNAANWCNGVIPSAASNVIVGPSANPTIGAAGGFVKITIKTGQH